MRIDRQLFGLLSLFPIVTDGDEIGRSSPVSGLIGFTNCTKIDEHAEHRQIHLLHSVSLCSLMVVENRLHQGRREGQWVLSLESELFPCSHTNTLWAVYCHYLCLRTVSRFSSLETQYGELKKGLPWGALNAAFLKWRFCLQLISV